MPDNDKLTYSYQQPSPGNKTDRAMITLERSQKLDLLLHLLTNLHQSLVVCGPPGIGKTKLLETVQHSRRDLWEISLLKATVGSSFESIIKDLLKSLNISNMAASFDLALLREQCAKHKVVLLIDDAGLLVPGLINMLMEFADSVTGLRLVFAMSYDEFHIKSGSDSQLENCHFIELPSLTKKQCGEYLQNLSAQPGAIVSFNAISEQLVDALYRDTHGIPGKILAELPKLSDYQNRRPSRMGLWLGIAVVLAGGGYAISILLPAYEALPLPAETLAAAHSVPAASTPPSLPVAEKIITPLPLPSTAVPSEAVVATTTANPVIASGNNATPKSEPIGTAPAITQSTPAQPVAATNVAAPSQPPEKTPVVAESAAAEVKAIAVKAPDSKAAKTTFEGSDQEWIMAQPANNFTLQVMVLSNKAAVTRLLKKYADYSDGLKYYTINNNDQEKFVLIYGSFKTAAEAAQFKTMMPGEFKQALEKRFKAVQKESR